MATTTAHPPAGSLLLLFLLFLELDRLAVGTDPVFDALVTLPRQDVIGDDLASLLDRLGPRCLEMGVLGLEGVERDLGDLAERDGGLDLDDLRLGGDLDGRSCPSARRWSCPPRSPWRRGAR
jgi:hypothetical protein